MPFTTVSGVAASHSAKWDGATWSSPGGGVSATVSALKVFDSPSGNGPALYVAGDFVTAGGRAAGGIARWNGEQWQPVGNGLCSVRAIANLPASDSTGPILYAGAGAEPVLDCAVHAPADRIAKWDGTSWTRRVSATSAPPGKASRGSASPPFGAGSRSKRYIEQSGIRTTVSALANSSGRVPAMPEFRVRQRRLALSARRVPR